MNRKIRLLLGIIAGLNSCWAVGQQIDLSGRWFGSASFLKEQSTLMYELKQDGNAVSGIVYSKNLTRGDSVVFSVNGDFVSNKIKLRATEIIYQTGIACMADSELKYSTVNGKQMLAGKWRGDLRLNTCAPVVSGAISIFREQPVYTPVVVDAMINNDATQLIEMDRLGEVLINELSKRTFYALVIGNEEYNDENIADLDNPVNDAAMLVDVLTAHYTFEPQNVTFLKNATRESIIRALDNLTEKVGETDNLLIFYAGHGIWNEKLNQGYWLPVDATTDSKSFWLSNSTLRDYLGGINSKHTLLISDACFSGGILKERAVFENSRAILEVYKMPSRKAMTSGTLKTVPDKSVFIEYLLKNLQQNQAPLLSADQLFRNFKTAVINNSPNGQVPQYGPIAQAGDEGGDFVFLRKSHP